MYSRFIRSPDADSVATALERDVVGAKSDTANTTAGTTSSLMRYVKGILSLLNSAAVVYTPRTAVSATAVIVNGDTLFTVAGGPIEIINLMSVCIASASGTASTLQYSVTHATLGDVTISGATGSLAAIAAGGFVTCQMTALDTAALVATEGATIASTGPSRIIMQPGLIKAVVGTGTTTATFKHYITYRPLASGITVV
jgi:hypothetical protein